MNGRSRPRGAAPESSAGRPDTSKDTSSQRRSLSAAVLDLIRGGAEDGSRAAWHIGLAMRNAGHSWGDYRAVMTDPLNGCSRWYRDLRDGRPSRDGKHRKTGRGEAGAIKELERIWRKVHRLPPPRRVDVSDVAERCQQVTASAASMLTGPSRATRLKVLAALCHEARLHRTYRILSPVRLVALAAGVSRDTAWRSLRDLNRVGLLRHTVTATAANTFELVEPSALALGQTCPSPRREESVLTKVHLDVWRHRDLGATGLLVHAALHDEEPAIAAELARTTGLHRNTVARRLRHLAARGLAVEVEPRWWVRGPTDPGQVVGPARGSRRRDAERFDRERAAYRELREAAS